MINKLLSILIILLVVSIGFITYQSMQPKVGIIDPLLKDNKAAQEIAALNIEVDVEDLGTDGNNYTVLGQTRWWNNGTVAEVVLDDSVDPNSYQAYAILYHELGHVLAIQQGTTNNEEAADEYAASRGYNIVDAYHGIH